MEAKGHAVACKHPRGEEARSSASTQNGEVSIEPFVAHASLLRLQRMCGNQTVLRMLGTPATAKRVQRYEAFEHATEGDKAKGSQTVTINGVSLTSGEINALADLYGSPQALESADPGELQQLVTLIHRQQADPKSVKESEWDTATHGRYTQLNLKNSSHFAPQNAALIPPQPGTTPGVDNRATFIRYHQEAIVWAARAWAAIHRPIGLPVPEEQARFMQHAQVSEGFAEHFLMDGFSAGHLFNKDDMLALIRKNLGALDKKDLAGVFSGAASSVWAKQASFIRQHKAKKYLVWWRLSSADRFQGLLEAVYDDADGKEAVYSAVVKAAHDRLNTRDAGGGQIGVPVENDFGSWVLSGDKTLVSSADTQKWIDKAIEQARANIAGAANNTSKESDDAVIKKVLAYFPRPTADSTKMIESMIKEVSDPKGGMVNAISEVMDRELFSLFEALKDRGFIKLDP
jgi:hypothetical protein